MGKKIIDNARTGVRAAAGRWPVPVHVLPSVRASASE